MSVRPNDGADVLFAKIQRADTVDIERRNWRWDFFWVKLGTHRQSGGQFVRRLNEGRVSLVAAASSFSASSASVIVPSLMSEHAPEQSGASTAQAAGIEIVAAIDACHD